MNTSEQGYLSIGEVLGLLKPEFSDLTISKIRFLESQGLLDPERTPSGYRKFYEPDVERLRWILRQQTENYLPLKVIKDKLEGEADNGDAAGDDHPPPAAGAPVDVAAANVSDARMGRSANDLVEETSASPEAIRVRGSREGPPPAEMGRGSDLNAGPTGVSLTLDELAAAAGLTSAQVVDLERYGLINGRSIGGTAFYDEEALIVTRLSRSFGRFGLEPRHLRMYRTAAEREAGVFEQIVMPLLKQRNPQARHQALETLTELTQLGQGLRAAMVRQALREYTER